MTTEEYQKVSVKIRGQSITLYYIDYGMIQDETSLRARCIDWHIEEDFEFAMGEECAVHAWLARFIDGKPVGENLEDIVAPRCEDL